MQQVRMLLLSIARQACGILRRHAVGISGLDPSLPGINALLHQASPLLWSHLFLVLLVHLLHHLWGSILHEVLVVLLYFLFRELSIRPLIPGIGILLVHLLVMLIKRPHAATPFSHSIKELKGIPLTRGR
jgi:hypothetical protein